MLRDHYAPKRLVKMDFVSRCGVRDFLGIFFLPVPHLAAINPTCFFGELPIKRRCPV